MLKIKMKKLFLTFIASLLLEGNSLVLEGKWHSDSEFFLFLSKFGFQKTNSHEGAFSEGFIFGNITSLENDDQSTSSGVSFNKEVGAMLVLLPRQFFFNFYGNSSTSGTKSSEDYDKICQAMFKDVWLEAYDARCHDTGREDFLRHIPCPVDQLCVDEDNPANVIPQSQLTYAIKDINNPRFWYLSLVACGLNASCGWQYSGDDIKVSYHLTLVNGKPPAKDHDFFAYHFSCEQQDVGELVLVCLLLYFFLLLPLQIYATYKMRLRVLEVFLCVLSLQSLGLVFAMTAQIIMGASGKWVAWVAAAGQICTLLCEAVFLLLLVLLARGWSVTAATGQHTVGLYLIWGSYTAVTLVLCTWNLVMVSPMEDSYQYGAWLGIFALVLRGVLTVWYLWELRNTMLIQHHPNTLHFLLQLGAASLVWLVYLPVVALVALQVSPLWRPKLLQGFRYTADFLAHVFMAYTLYPRQSHPYVILATPEDHCEELDFLDQAPQVLHRRAQRLRRGDQRSSLSEGLGENGDMRVPYTDLLDAEETVQFERFSGTLESGVSDLHIFGVTDRARSGVSNQMNSPAKYEFQVNRNDVLVTTDNGRYFDPEALERRPVTLSSSVKLIELDDTDKAEASSDYYVNNLLDGSHSSPLPPQGVVASSTSTSKEGFSPEFLSDESDTELLVVVKDKKSWPL
ncbi:uncharacterized protein LOC108666680 isoform X2 [Hyalella azteca]|uniref:Uncharacterized protein LOC108666680 isoform X2 n=1 Tax=Hyalella azteca TaxID=294128 RepID=A0A8B7N5G0_HYAAZ|nr:uncharacterized protein LOC108666680 isoform X2 [Hyalella azteca]